MSPFLPYEHERMAKSSNDCLDLDINRLLFRLRIVQNEFLRTGCLSATGSYSAVDIGRRQRHGDCLAGKTTKKPRRTEQITKGATSERSHYYKAIASKPEPQISLISMKKPFIGLLGSAVLTLIGIMVRLKAHALAWPDTSYSYSGPPSETMWGRQEIAIGQIGITLMAAGILIFGVTYFYWLFNKSKD